MNFILDQHLRGTIPQIIHWLGPNIFVLFVGTKLQENITEFILAKAVKAFLSEQFVKSYLMPVVKPRTVLLTKGKEIAANIAGTYILNSNEYKKC